MEFFYRKKELPKIAKALIKNCNTNTLAFYAPMGAGKTTLIKAIVHELGGKNEVSSPTFGVVNEYEKENGALLGYHFDFYRLTDEMEAMDMGFEEYLNADTWIFIEWPEKIPNLIPEDAHTITIEIIDPETRRLKLS